MWRHLLWIGMMFGVSAPGYAQKINHDYQLSIFHASEPLTIDGILDEPTWQQANVADKFHMVLPMDTSMAIILTQVRMAYDDKNLYLSVVCNHPAGQRYIVQSLRRDFTFGKNDNFLFFMDPFNDLTNGFSFGANAAGAQWDGTMYEGGAVDLSWDNKWTSAVHAFEDKYVIEMSIPFKSIRYKKGIKEWGVNFSRLDVQSTEKSAWAPVPRQFPTASLAYTGSVVFDEPPPAPGANISLIPYVLTNLSKDFTKDEKAGFDYRVGGDAKIAITSSLNLDLTVNPDFSQVEVDQQQTNLDRFELFFPERRQFFLENGDLFNNFGYSTIRPFFSRRIGLDAPIDGGLRLSGKLNENWRIGVMDMQTRKVEETGLAAQNFGVFALQRKVFSRSNIGVMFVNKAAVGNQDQADYNRNLGLEYNLASSNNLWTGKALFLKSWSPESQGKDFIHAGHLQYKSRKWQILWQHEIVGENFNAEVGFVPRTGYINLKPMAGRLFFPKGGSILSHGPTLGSTIFFDSQGKFTDNTTYMMYNLNFRSQSVFTAWVGYDYVELLQPFDPTNTGKEQLPIGSKHNWRSFGTVFTSKPQSLFTYGFSTRYGGYYQHGKRLNITTDIGYRFQPYVSLALNTNYNLIELDAPWNNTTFWLVGPRLDVTLTNKLYFTTFVQYNQQTDNLNINARFQWRYQPASDIYLVFTDNYLPDPFSIRNRAVVLKMNYWWNL
ncbi:MAG: carbohydrate binding family 9 domain-containing protein [Saprospiraceae bacterium]|nr:carbohydrate binding family 9 domain-containing protein [Saprospiraceae bacterium]